LEGIGSLNGLLNESCLFFTPCDDNYELLCFHKDSLLLYDNPDFEGCFIKHINVSATRYKSENKVSVFPNPTSTEIHIKLNTYPVTNLTGKLIAIDGAIIKTFKMDSSTAYTLDVKSLTSGLYFVQICSGTEIYTKKIIID